MAHKTVNLELLKPEAEDFYNIEVHNRNMDILDAACQEGKNAVQSVQIDGVELEKSDGVVNLPAYPEGYVHPDTPGSRHIPAGGAAGQVLGWKEDGAAEWMEVRPISHMVIIQEVNWTDSVEYAEYPYSAYVDIAGVTEFDIANGIVHPETEAVAQNAGLAYITDTTEGKVVFYACNIPKNPIRVILSIFKGREGS